MTQWSLKLQVWTIDAQIVCCWYEYRGQVEVRRQALSHAYLVQELDAI